MLSSLKKKLARYLHHPQIPIGAILMLHRTDTHNKEGIWYNQHLKMSAETIEEMVKYAREKGCRFVSLEEMSNAIKRKKYIRRWIAVTLDDGYRDNFEIGYPCFKHLNVPFCIYVTTNMVEGKMYYWWEYLERLILNHDSITLSDGQTFACHTQEEKEQAFLDIREIILKAPQDDYSQIGALFPSEYGFDATFGKDDLGLTWSQIQQLGEEPLATIGNHTYSHKAFTGCADQEILDDIILAQREMSLRANLDMKHFAFPFGEATAISQHDIDLVKNSGFSTSATTRSDYIRYGTDLLEMPRFFVTEKNWRSVIDGIVANC